jgi:CubicO group peptidase (beta-lactamase class C family)
MPVQELLILLILLQAAFLKGAVGDGDLQKRKEFLLPKDRAQKFQTADKAFPHRTVQAGKNVWKLEKLAKNQTYSVRYTWRGATNNIDDFNRRTATSALLILQNNHIVTELYLAGSTAKTRFMSFSMGKSITSTLIGMALEDGRIESIDNRLTKYLPALTGSAYEPVTIKDALQMLSGIEFDPESNDWNDLSNPQAKVFKEAADEQRYRYVEAANTLTRKEPVGTKFIYNSMNTCLLGWVIENVTRKRLATYMQERLWQPAGMEADAAWLLDGPPEIGREIASGRFLATLRDYGRFGLLIVNGGEANGNRLISRDWIKAATTPSRPSLQFGKLYKDYPLGYGYSWWLFENGRFAAIGMFGQFIYIAPKEKVVIVKLSHWPEGWVDDMEMECYAFFDAVVESIK